MIDKFESIMLQDDVSSVLCFRLKLSLTYTNMIALPRFHGRSRLVIEGTRKQRIAIEGNVILEQC